MRIIDWSSDVCSSDLVAGIIAEPGGQPRDVGDARRAGAGQILLRRGADRGRDRLQRFLAAAGRHHDRAFAPVMRRDAGSSKRYLTNSSAAAPLYDVIGKTDLNEACKPLSLRLDGCVSACR